MFTAILGLNPSKGARSPVIWNYLYDKFKIDCRMYTIDYETTSAFLDEIKRLELIRNFWVARSQLLIKKS